MDYCVYDIDGNFICDYGEYCKEYYNILQKALDKLPNNAYGVVIGINVYINDKRCFVIREKAKYRLDMLRYEL